MKILMIAPEPFFQERGTPFSEFYRVKALTELGHKVDMVTYPLGRDIGLNGLRIFRVAKLPYMKIIPVGPSLIKIPLDFLVFFKSLYLLIKNRYDLIHTHEEAGMMGVIFKILFRKRHIYDMHSSLSEQFINFNVTRNKIFLKIIEYFEKIMVKKSDCVIVICDHLREVARKLYRDVKVIVIDNTINPAFYDYFPKDVNEIDLGFCEGKKLILYVGTFEYYQGIDIIIDAARYIKENKSSEGVVIACIGGNTEQQNELRRIVGEKGVSDLFYISGRVSHIAASKLIDRADILLSPRKEGVNTPLKIYSYLYSGKPIVATNLLTHTQVLNDEVAVLCEPKGEEFGRAIIELLQDSKMSKRLGDSAKRYFEKKYAYDKYRELIKEAIDIAIGN